MLSLNLLIFVITVKGFEPAPLVLETIMLTQSQQDTYFFLNVWRTLVLYVGPLVLLLWTSGDVSEFQSQSGQPYLCLADAYVTLFNILISLGCCRVNQSSGLMSNQRKLLVVATFIYLEQKLLSKRKKP